MARRGRFTAPIADLSASRAHDQMKLVKSIIGPRWLFRYLHDFVISHNHVSATWRRFRRKTTPIRFNIGIVCVKPSRYAVLASASSFAAAQSLQAVGC